MTPTNYQPYLFKSTKETEKLNPFVSFCYGFLEDTEINLCFDDFYL